jgi:signal transduction histidine kinase
MALYREDGILLAIDPYDDAAIGRSDAHRPLFMQHLPNARDGSFGANAGRSAWRLAGYRHVESYPLVMTVQQSQWSALSGWWADAAAIGSLGLFATLLVCLMLLSLARAAAQREDQFDRLSVAKANSDARARRAEAMAQVRALMVANMGHELRSPLNAVIGFSDVLKGGGELATRRMQEYAASIHRAGSHLLQVVEDLLDTASLDAGRLKLSEADVDPIEIARFVADIMSERATKGGVTLAVATPNRLPLVRGDALRLRQVLLNLTANAIKYTRRGGSVTLAVEQAEDGRLAWRVSDNGVGMTAEQIAIALEPFGRVNNEVTRTHEGHGLGLPLARSLTELHGGAFEIESKPGFGTSVRVVLPRERVIGGKLASIAA